MSALPPKADIAERDRHLRFVPKADICSLAHLVGEQLNLIGSAEIERLGAFGWSDLLCLVFRFLDLLLKKLFVRSFQRDQLDR
jgi:hypothetical protein